MPYRHRPKSQTHSPSPDRRSSRRPRPARGLERRLRGLSYARSAELLSPKARTLSPGVRGPGGSRDNLEYNPVIGDNPFAPTDPEARAGSGALPFTETGWDATAILENMTQLDTLAATTSDVSRCAGQATLAVHIPAGPSSVAAVAQDVVTRIRAQVASQQGAYPAPPLAGLLPTLEALPARLSGRTATWNDLGLLAHAMKTLVSPLFLNGCEPDPVQEMATLGGGRRAELQGQHRGWAAVEALVAALCAQGNLSAVLGVGITEHGTIDHAVTLSVEDGDVILYDPAPRQGRQRLRLSTDERDIRDYFEAPDGAARLWRVDSALGAAPGSGL